jgi:Phosphatidylethanolamine-binding protein
LRIDQCLEFVAEQWLAGISAPASCATGTGTAGGSTFWALLVHYWRGCGSPDGKRIHTALIRLRMRSEFGRAHPTSSRHAAPKYAFNSATGGAAGRNPYSFNLATSATRIWAGTDIPRQGAVRPGAYQDMKLPPRRTNRMNQHALIKVAEAKQENRYGGPHPPKRTHHSNVVVVALSTPKRTIQQNAEIRVQRFEQISPKRSVEPRSETLKSCTSAVGMPRK